MYSVDEIIEQIDGESEIEDNLEENSQENEETEDKDEKAGSATKVQPKTKRKLGNRPKLDAERLKGPRGLICIEKMFSDMKFKGRGYEKQDLNQVMNNLQYWCHRLFPKFTFDDCLAQLERLGTKKPVMTLRKKILYNMIEEEQTPQYENIIDEDMPESQQEAISQFDLLLNQQIPTSLPPTQPAVTAEVVELTDEQKEMIEKNRQLAAERRRARLEAMKQKQEENELQMSQESQISNSLPLSLTEEQRVIIERNRLLAVEKRKQLHNKTENLSQNTEEIITDNSVSINDHQTMQATELNKQVDTEITNENQDLEITSEKQDIVITNENLDMAITDENQDIDITNENQDMAITSENQDIVITNENQDMAITNENRDIEITNENLDMAITDENQDIDITNENQNIDITTEEKQNENSEMEID